eukprot:6214661-Pleurochrysis_carterae.AAC.3
MQSVVRAFGEGGGGDDRGVADVAASLELSAQMRRAWLEVFSNSSFKRLGQEMKDDYGDWVTNSFVSPSTPRVGRSGGGAHASSALQRCSTEL